MTANPDKPGTGPQDDPDGHADGYPTLQIPLGELATIAMLVEGAHTMNSAQTRLALSRGPVLDAAIARLKAALVRAGAEQHGPGWRPRQDPPGR